VSVGGMEYGRYMEGGGGEGGATLYSLGPENRFVLEGNGGGQGIYAEGAGQGYAGQLEGRNVYNNPGRGQTVYALRGVSPMGGRHPFIGGNEQRTLEGMPTYRNSPASYSEGFGDGGSFGRGSFQGQINSGRNPLHSVPSYQSGIGGVSDRGVFGLGDYGSGGGGFGSYGTGQGYGSGVLSVGGYGSGVTRDYGSANVGHGPGLTFPNYASGLPEYGSGVGGSFGNFGPSFGNTGFFGRGTANYGSGVGGFNNFGSGLGNLADYGSSLDSFGSYGSGGGALPNYGSNPGNYGSDSVGSGGGGSVYSLRDGGFYPNRGYMYQGGGEDQRSRAHHEIKQVEMEIAHPMKVSHHVPYSLPMEKSVRVPIEKGVPSYPAEKQLYSVQVMRKVPQAVTQTMTQSVPHAMTQSVGQSMPQSVTHSLPQSVAHSLPQSVAHTMTQSASHSMPQSMSHSYPLSVPLFKTRYVLQKPN
jgi:hypothetical protein